MDGPGQGPRAGGSFVPGDGGTDRVDATRHNELFALVP